MNVLGMFAKYWLPGAVKTRLARSIGEVQASRLYSQFLVLLLRRLESTGDRRVLVYSPENWRAEFAEIASAGWELTPQSSGDLGQRMEAYFATHLRGAQDRVVLIGTDSPTLPKSLIDDAFDALRTCRVVLGPSSDGGYYLVGASGQVPPIFEGIDWSTPAVWRQTTERLADAGLKFAELPEWYDVDEWSDLERIHAELKQLKRDDVIWHELAHEVRTALAGSS